MTSNGRVSSFAASGSDASCKVGLSGDDGWFPRLVRVFRCGGDDHLIFAVGIVRFGWWCQQHGTLVHPATGEVDPVVLSGSGSVRVVVGFFTRVQWTNGGDDIGTTNQWDPLVESWLDVKCALVHYSRDPVDPLTIEGAGVVASSDTFVRARAINPVALHQFCI